MDVTTAPVIQLNHTRFSWKQGHPRLVIDELFVNKGEKLFIQGPSGSGKTTLLGLLGGVLVPESGSVSVLGQPLNELPSSQRDRFRANHIGFVFQMFNLISYLSVIENITLPLQFADSRTKRLTEKSLHPVTEAKRLLRQLGLHDAELLTRPVTELSIGQQQRVAAARALIGQPDIIIADEPTSALDADSRQAFIRLLFTECEAAGSTLIFVSHDTSLEALFDRSISLNSLNKAPIKRHVLSLKIRRNRMTITGLAWKSLKNRKVAAILTILSIAVSVALLWAWNAYAQKPGKVLLILCQERI